MTEGHLPEQGQFPERRSADREISVLINAGIVHQGRDSLCRIRNLSGGGVMIECNLPLAVDDAVSLCLRSGHELGGRVRWVHEGRAGIAFDEPACAALVSGRPGLSIVARSAAPIGYPQFRRTAWVRLATAHQRERVVVGAISPTGIIVETARDWGREHLFTISIDGVGDYGARREAAAQCDEDMMVLLFVQPLHYRAFSEWLVATPSAEVPLPLIAARDGHQHWV